VRLREIKRERVRGGRYNEGFEEVLGLEGFEDGARGNIHIEEVRVE
jgi:hypothetical protein